MKKFICMLSVCLALLLVVAASAEEIVPYASDLISSTSISASRPGNGVVTFTFKVTSTDMADKLGIQSAKIQEYSESDGQWHTVVGKYSQFKTNAMTYSITLQYSGTIAKQYRGVGEFYVQVGNLSETRFRTSSFITAR